MDSMRRLRESISSWRASVFGIIERASISFRRTPIGSSKSRVSGGMHHRSDTDPCPTTEIAPIETVRERIAREVAIRVKGPADRNMFQTLGEIFSRHRGDRRVSFDIELPASPTP